MRGLLPGVALLACACSAELSPAAIEAPTALLVVVEGLAPGDLTGRLGEIAAPTLSGLVQEGATLQSLAPTAPSSSALLASVLTGLPVSEHGLRSPVELGAGRLAASVPTLAEQVGERGWLTLGATSSDSWALQGLDRGLAPLVSPEPAGARTLSPAAIGEALRGRLAEVVREPRGLLVVLHLDLASRAGAPEPSRAMLELALQPWRGAGGEVDRIFADEASGDPLATRLRHGFGRRGNDPRGEALAEAMRAARLEAFDAELLGLLRSLEGAGRSEVALALVGVDLEAGSGLLLTRPGDPSWLPHQGPRRSVGSWLEEPRPVPPRSVALAVDGDSEVTVTLLADEGEVWSREGAEVGPRVELGPGQEQEVEAASRAAGLRLRLEGPRLFQLAADRIALGGRTLASCDLPELVATRSPEWPEHALVGPLVDLQKAGPRRMRATVAAPEGAQVELLLEGWPEDPSLLEGVSAAGAEVRRDPRRPGAVWLSGTGRLEVEFDTRGPGDRLALLCRIDGERVDRSRMRYLGRVLGAPEQLELLASEGAWLDPGLAQEPAADAAVRAQWRDGGRRTREPALPSAPDLARLRRLGADG